MTIKFKLLASEVEKENGFPLVLKFSHGQKRKQVEIGFSKIKHFFDKEQSISKSHPDYEILAPKMAEIEKRIRKVILQNITDIEKAKNEIYYILIKIMCQQFLLVDAIIRNYNLHPCFDSQLFLLF